MLDAKSAKVAKAAKICKEERVSTKRLAPLRPV
jgi:hypothetical protein